jgi:hypothetical protein
MSEGRYYGKYKGWVTSTMQASANGRLGVRVPLGGRNPVDAIAEACIPYAGGSNGMFAIPPVGSGVWVEFQGGDPDGMAIWTGCWWKDDTELPSAFGATAGLASLPVIVQSTSGNRLVLGAGGGNAIVLETLQGENGPRVRITDTSVLISCGPANTIEITSSEVKINGDALVVR